MKIKLQISFLVIILTIIKFLIISTTEASEQKSLRELFNCFRTH